MLCVPVLSVLAGSLRTPVSAPCPACAIGHAGSGDGGQQARWQSLPT